MLGRNRLGQSGPVELRDLGRLPIVLLRIAARHRIEIVRQLVQAHAYWREKGIDGRAGHPERGRLRLPPVAARPDLGLDRLGIEAQMLDKPGGIFVRRSEQVRSDDLVLLQTSARVILDDEPGPWRSSSSSAGPSSRRSPRSCPRDPPARRRPSAAPRELIFFERSGRVHARRARVRHHARARADDAGPVGQRAGQPLVRHGRLGERQRLHVGGERPRIPAHALEQRPRRDTRGEALYIRDERPGSSGRRRRCPRAGARPT
jgi:cyclic beta-1,2-glucan synthetase